MTNIDEDIKLLENFNAGDEYTEKIKQAIDRLIKAYRELEERELFEELNRGNY